MDGWQASDGGQDEELPLPQRSPRRDRTMLGIAAVLLIAGSGLVGWRLGRESPHATATAASPPAAAPPAAAPPSAAPGIELIAGPFQANAPATYEGPELVISIYNVGDRQVRIANVAPAGWHATSEPVTIAAGGSADVPVDVSVDCRRTPPPTDEVRVRATSSGQSATHTLHLPSVPAALTEEYNRLCASPPERTPSRQELLGVWIVDEANFFAGKMLIRLNSTGTFAMDPFTTLFSRPGAYGRFGYRAGNLALSTRGGQDCPRGDRSLWRVGMMSDGRLRMSLISSYHSVCTVQAGEVWIARRVSPPTR